MIGGFIKQHNVKNLVYQKCYETAEVAIGRDKRLKRWKRRWKLDLIEKMNPSWNDLYESIR